jgi:hypothetical protein
MPKSTAYYCRDRERQRQQGTALSPLARQALAEPVEVREKLAQRLVSIYEYHLGRVEDQISKNRPLSPAEARLAGQMFRDVAGALGKPDPKKPPSSRPLPHGQEPHDEKLENPLTKLLADHERTGRGLPAERIPA